MLATTPPGPAGSDAIGRPADVEWHRLIRRGRRFRLLRERCEAGGAPDAVRVLAVSPRLRRSCLRSILRDRNARIEEHRPGDVRERRRLHRHRARCLRGGAREAERTACRVGERRPERCRIHAPGRGRPSLASHRRRQRRTPTPRRSGRAGLPDRPGQRDLPALGRPAHLPGLPALGLPAHLPGPPALGRRPAHLPGLPALGRPAHLPRLVGPSGLAALGCSTRSSSRLSSRPRSSDRRTWPYCPSWLAQHTP